MRGPFQAGIFRIGRVGRIETYGLVWLMERPGLRRCMSGLGTFRLIFLAAKRTSKVLEILG